MAPDEHVCLCFHVSKRKLTNYLRVERVTRASQLSECQGAGTGCGWCVPFLQRLFEQARGGSTVELPTAEKYAMDRKSYIEDGKGSPPT